MKLLIILVLFIFLAMLIASRYRRQIKTVQYVWKTFKKMRQIDRPDGKPIEPSNNTKDVPLIRCAKCGVWIEQKNALNLRSETFYCSANCIEEEVVVK